MPRYVYIWHGRHYPGKGGTTNWLTDQRHRNAEAGEDLGVGNRMFTCWKSEIVHFQFPFYNHFGILQ